MCIRDSAYFNHKNNLNIGLPTNWITDRLSYLVAPLMSLHNKLADVPLLKKHSLGTYHTEIGQCILMCQKVVKGYSVSGYNYFIYIL